MPLLAPATARALAAMELCSDLSAKGSYVHLCDIVVLNVRAIPAVQSIDRFGWLVYTVSRAEEQRDSLGCTCVRSALR